MSINYYRFLFTHKNIFELLYILAINNLIRITNYTQRAGSLHILGMRLARELFIKLPWSSKWWIVKKIRNFSWCLLEDDENVYLLCRYGLIRNSCVGAYIKYVENMRVEYNLLYLQVVNNSCIKIYYCE